MAFHHALESFADTIEIWSEVMKEDTKSQLKSYPVPQTSTCWPGTKCNAEIVVPAAERVVRTLFGFYILTVVSHQQV